MIYIKRPEAPDFLTDKDGRWCQETTAAIAHYNNGHKEAFKFELYNDKAVKNALKEVFVKCAYCESSYGAVYDGDVEHFRPKGRIKEKDPQTPGYYWLANNWDNLFLACQHCNQRRKHILFGEDNEEGYGKLDQFPLEGGDQHRLKDHNDLLLDNEEGARLLINPCLDDPRLHLAYEETEGVVVPLTAKGEKSVLVYVLQRPLLVRERKIQLIKLFAQMECAKRELRRLNNNPKDTEQQDVFKVELARLMEYADSKANYAGMSRFFIGRFLTENNLR